MIKKLRIKFICVNMLIVAVMLLVILGTVLHFTEENLKMESISMMQKAAGEPFFPNEPGRFPHQRLPMVIARVDMTGRVSSVSSNFGQAAAPSDIQELVDEARAHRKDSGVLRGYDLRFFKTMGAGGQVVVFCSTEGEEETLRDLFYSCLLIGGASLVVFFGISILLARWAVRPVEQAWTQQRQFVADASHELKTPLAVILSNAELLQSGECSEEETQKFTAGIHTASLRMRSLVEELLDMARLDSNGAKVTFSRVELSQLAEDAALSMQLLYEEKGLSLQTALEEDVRIRGSEAHLFQLMDVLLDNALKYSSPGAAVEVKLRRQGGNCLLQVINPGEPISAEDLKNIFKRFYRIDKARTASGSYGLGLSLAEQIAALHRGKIWAESSEGRNIFTVQLPVEK